MGGQHTPGPWRVAAGADQYICNDDNWVASTMGVKGEEGAANARLIAAAPELLEACDLLDAYLYATARGSNERQIVLAAIAKARGQ